MEQSPFTGLPVTDNSHINDVRIGDPMKNLGLTADPYDSAYRLWGHTLKVRSGEVECAHCEMKEEVPDIVQKGSPFRAVVYQMYIFGEFRDASCEPESVPFNKPNNGTIVDIGGEHYRYSGNDTWVSMQPPHDSRTTSEIAKEQQEKTNKRHHKRFGTYDFYDPVTNRSDVGGPHHDATQTSLTWRADDDLSKKEKKSLVEKLSSKF